MNFIARILLEIIRLPLLAVWYAWGWRFEKHPPDLDKYVLITVPHTSYWDYYHMMMMALEIRRRPRTTTKHTLFWFPLGPILWALGCIPINREQALNAVDWIAGLFNQEKRMILAITVEGTRKKTRFWKSGFYYIALKANVPIVCGYIDYKRKRGGAELVIHPSGDIHADFERIRDYYMRYGRNGKHLEQVSDVALKEHKHERLTMDAIGTASQPTDQTDV
jgi:1-acyl-sn-glycerol-3-phosphate acyltransferase